MGGGGPVRNTKKYRKRQREFAKAQIAGDEIIAARLAALPPDHPHRNPKPFVPGQLTADDEFFDYPYPEMWGVSQKSTEWVSTEPKPKSEEEIAKERVEATLEGWPWKGVPQKLATIVSTLVLGFRN